MAFTWQPKTGEEHETEEQGDENEEGEEDWQWEEGEEWTQDDWGEDYDQWGDDYQQTGYWVDDGYWYPADDGNTYEDEEMYEHMTSLGFHYDADNDYYYDPNE